MRDMVAHYSGNCEADKSCPNCGQIEKAEHLCVCPCKDRTRLINESAEELGSWMFADNRTEPQIAYWVPKFIMYRGNKKFSEMGDMSPEIIALAESQDLIGWRNFMEGRISKSFYTIQSWYLSDSQSYMNGQDWTKKFISKILQITHSQWIFRNISLHDENLGDLRRKEMKSMIFEAEELAVTSPVNLPKESRFLLEMDGVNDSIKCLSYHDMNYWLGAMRAAIKAGVRKASGRRRAKKAVVALAKTRRPCTKSIDEQVRRENESVSDVPLECVRTKSGKSRVVSGPSRMAAMRSNKRFKPGD